MKIVVTRPRERAGRLVERLQALEHDVVVCPLIAVEPIGDDPIGVSGYDWVVVTSANGAKALVRRMGGRPAKVAAIGSATADALRRAGIEPALVPRVSTQEGLLAELPRPAGRVLFAGAEGARRLLIDELAADFIPLYRTRQLRPRVPAADVVVLASASAARAYGELGLDIPAVSIGPETTRAATAARVRVVAEAKSHDVDGLVAAVASVALD